MAGALFPSVRVMLVSDFPVVAWGLEKLFESRGPAIVLAGTAGTRADVLALLPTAAPDVVLIDIDGAHGPDTVGDLVARSEAKVLALTASTDTTVHDAVVLAGANGVVRKCDPAEVLVKAVERVHAGEIWVDRMAAGRIFVALARRKAAHDQDPERTKIAGLTRKERQVISAIARDASASGRQVAARLFISEHTLRNHLSAIYRKLGVSTRLELFAFANRHGIAQEPASTQARI